MESKEHLQTLWKQLYPDSSVAIPVDFLNSVKPVKQGPEINNDASDWYKDAIVYSLYVDKYNKDFSGLKEKLPYFNELGINCLWLLPVLDSPYRDAGFDISDYYSIRSNLLKEGKGQEDFDEFIKEAHKQGIKIIFDIAINHTSDQHPWFCESRKSKDNPYRNYYIWSGNAEKYKDARIIFKGIEESNWEKDGDKYYFHRFFSFQPDLNFRNPEVLLEICRIFLYWQNKGVDGFRVDAIPYLWKDEGADCENRPLTHVIIKFIRVVLDYCKPGTLLLAEACQKPGKVVEYLGSGDECHAVYNFPLMPMIFKSIAAHSSKSIIQLFDKAITPEIPENSQWFTFLRCHDELSLEKVYVTEEDRSFIYQNYCHNAEWDFREGEGISSRLANLMQFDSGRIMLAFSIILSLPGTPVIYYGDEFGMPNDPDHYREAMSLSCKDDSRYLVRGRINLAEIEKKMKDPESFNRKIFEKIKQMIRVRNRYSLFGRGDIQFPDSHDEILIYKREYLNDKILIVNNLSDRQLSFDQKDGIELLDQPLDGYVEPFGYRWIKLW